jgi:hypothetical protein
VLPSNHSTLWRATHSVLPSEPGALFRVARSHQQDATERTGEGRPLFTLGHSCIGPQ